MGGKIASGSEKTEADAGSESSLADGKPGDAEQADEVAPGGATVSPTPGGIVYPEGDTTGTLTAALDWTLVDQYGEEHSLADYRGKIVFLNFWTTWCPYCVKEMPDIQQLYEDYGCNEGDVVILGVANPTVDSRRQNSDVSEEKVLEFLDEQGVTYPVLMDYTSDIFTGYKVYYLPTTYMIDPYGNVFGYVTGGMERDTMDTIVESTLAGDLEKRLGL